MPPESVRDSDRSNGWEAVAGTFIDSGIGVKIIEAWNESLPLGGAVLDLGCGPGGMRAAVLNDAHTVYAIDAAPTMAQAYQRHFPGATVICEAVEESGFFGRLFDGAMAWGLIFLLPPDVQQDVIHRVAAALKPGARFLFTAPAQRCEWPDNSTGRTSYSLGADAYRTALGEANLELVAEYVDEGENHYYDAVKLSVSERSTHP